MSLTLILILAIIGFGLIYLLTFHPFRSASMKTIYVPKKAVTYLRKNSEHNNREIAMELDYTQKSAPYPSKEIIKRGTNGEVNPGLFASEEIIAHTHGPVRNKDPITNAYETELRERPSIADLLFSKRQGIEFVSTPSGRLLEFNAEHANIRKLNNKIEREAQMKANEQIFPSDPKTARESARLANYYFIKKTESLGVKYKQLDPNKPIKFKTEVK